MLLNRSLQTMLMNSLKILISNMDEKNALLNFIGSFYGQASKLDKDTVQRSRDSAPVSQEYKKIFEQVVMSPQPAIQPVQQPVSPVADNPNLKPYQPLPEEVIQQAIPEKSNPVYYKEPVEPENTLPLEPLSKPPQHATNQADLIVVALNNINDTLKNIEKLLTPKPNARQRKTKDTKQA